MQARSLILLVVALLAACSPSTAAPTATPAPSGSVTINHPGEATTIYAELFYAQGVASEVSTFTLDIVDADDVVIQSVPVVVGEGGAWTVEIPHGYTGEPAEVTVIARPSDAESTHVFASTTVILAGIAYRPDGSFAAITSPPTGQQVGGEAIPVSGTASGLFENTLLVGLYDADGEQISMVIVTLTNPYFVDNAAWSAALPTNGYLGSAQIRAFYNEPRDGKETVLAQIDVEIGEPAG